MQNLSNLDLFLIAAEPSGDLHGAVLIQELLRLHPHLKIAAVGGPKMRKLPIQVLFPMEDLQVMGFIDVFKALPRIAKQFFKIRRTILFLQPKAVICIDYPGFNLRLEKALRKKNYQGKLIHYICPTVWAWGKKRILHMEKNLDLLLTLFPFEKNCFTSTNLQVTYVGHPLITKISTPAPNQKSKILGLFPGSRKSEILRNFPYQLAAAKKLLTLDSEAEIAVSIANQELEPWITSLAQKAKIPFSPFTAPYPLMQKTRLALATSGTVTLELALHATPALVHYALPLIDQFLAQKIFRINLPFYCIVNIILSKEVFPELIGPNFTGNALDAFVQSLWFDEERLNAIKAKCQLLKDTLGLKDASQEAALAISDLL